MAEQEAKTGNKKVLFLCKSAHLAELVRSKIGETVSVLDTDSLFSHVAEDFNMLEPPYYSGIVNKLKPDVEVYDAIFVDEAQDFSPEWATLVRRLLADATESRLGVFYDDVQVLREESFGDGFGILSKPFLLRENIRNTANIYNWTAAKTRLGMDVVANPVEGPTPQTEFISDQRNMTHYLEVFFRRYLDDEHLSSSSLAVIVNDVSVFLEQYSDGIAKWRFVRKKVEQENEIRVYSVEEIKGLESDMILYIHDSKVSENENYIAYTRAKYYLIELVRRY